MITLEHTVKDVEELKIIVSLQMKRRTKCILSSLSKKPRKKPFPILADELLGRELQQNRANNDANPID
jgi:hypothetical protein